MELETKKGLIYINNFDNIYAIEMTEQNWGGKIYVIEIHWLTKKNESDYIQDFEKRIEFTTKEKAIEAYKKIVKKINK